MSRALPADERWARWCADMDDVHQELTTLFHTRWLWRTFIEMLRFNDDVQQMTVVNNWLIRCYGSTVCTAIRREGDTDARTTSLARCLESLIQCPHLIDRRRWVAIVTADDGGDERLQRRVSRAYDAFAATGTEHLDVARIEADRDRVRSAVAPVKKYTDKVLAHRERNHNVQKVKLSFGEVDHALDTLGDVYKVYYRLRHPGDTLANLTPAVDYTFLNMFEKRWYRMGFCPPDEMSMG